MKPSRTFMIALQFMWFCHSTAQAGCFNLLLKLVAPATRKETIDPAQARSPIIISEVLNRHPDAKLEDIFSEIHHTKGLPFDFKFITRLKYAEIVDIASDPRLAGEIYDSLHPDFLKDKEIRTAIKSNPKKVKLEFIKRLQLESRVVLIRKEFPNLTGLPYFRDSDFLRQAELGGLKTEIFPVSYRFDSRSPSEVSSSNGFQPKEGKEKLTLLEHSFHGTQGGYFVSLTLDSDNPGLAAALSHQIGFAIPDPQRALNDSGFSDNKAEPNAYSRMMYQYQIEEITGVKTKEHGLDFEEEIVTNVVSSKHISQYRPVYLIRVLQPGKPFSREKIFYGRWQPFNVK